MTEEKGYLCRQLQSDLAMAIQTYQSSSGSQVQLQTEEDTLNFFSDAPHSSDHNYGAGDTEYPEEILHRVACSTN